MIVDNYYLIICALGLMGFTCWGLIDLLSKGWTYPYKYYIIIKFLWALVYLFSFPFWDRWLGIHVSQMLLLLTSAIVPPLVLLVFVCIVNIVEKISVFAVIITSIPFVVSRYCFAFVDNRPLSVVLLAICIVLILWYDFRVVFHLEQYERNLKDYVSDTTRFSNGQMNLWLFVVSTATIIYLYSYFIRGQLYADGKNWMLSFGVICLFPLFVIFERQFEKQKWFQTFKSDIHPHQPFDKVVYKIDNTFLKQKAKSPHRAHNLRPATAAMMRLADQIEAESRQFPPISDYGNLKDTYDEIDRRLEQLERKFTNYLNPDFSLSRMARMLGITPKLLTDYLHFHHASFYDYVADMRIAYAIILLDRNPTLTNDQLAEACGYTTTQAFLKAFRVVRKDTPEKYRKSLME